MIHPSPNIQLMLGAALFLAPPVLSAQVVQTQIKEKAGGLWKGFMNLFKSSPSPKPSPDDVTITEVVIDSPLGVHKVVTALMAFFSNRNDSNGVTLASAIGQHMYEANAGWMNAPVKDNPEKVSTK